MFSLLAELTMGCQASTPVYPPVPAHVAHHHRRPTPRPARVVPDLTRLLNNCTVAAEEGGVAGILLDDNVRVVWYLCG